jgi:hypothetical protein
VLARLDSSGVAFVFLTFGVWDRFMGVGLFASAALEKHHPDFVFFSSKLSSGWSF